MSKRKPSANPQSFKEKMKDRFYIDRLMDFSTDYKDSWLLAGGARTGTTWVSDIINHDNSRRYIFEPFRNDRAETCRIFEGRQYLRPELHNEPYYSATRTILTGRLKQRWSDKHNQRFISSRRLIKAIRVNLMLKWIRVNFPELPIVFLLRHPFAVTASKLKLGWPSGLDTFTQQTNLTEDYLHQFRDTLDSDLSDFQRHLIFWCIEYFIPMQQLQSNDVHVVYYEDLCTNPRATIENMFGYLGKPFSDAVLKQLDRPSSVTRPGSAILTGQNMIDTWSGYLTENQIAEGKDLLAAFGLDNVYDSDGIPTHRYLT